MSDSGYTQEFWARAFEMQNYRRKCCEKCFTKHGEESTNVLAKRKPKKRSFVEVRVALRIGRRIHPDNLGFFCTKCKRGNQLRVPKFVPGEYMESLFHEADRAGGVRNG